MSNCECGEIHLRYNGSIEWKGHKQPVIKWHSVTCDSCGKSWLFLPETEDEIQRQEDEFVTELSAHLEGG